jgi:hypothetical protein
MLYRSFGDRSASVSAITVRLDDSQRVGGAANWRDLVFAAMEAGVNAFEIGQTNKAMRAGLAEAFAAVDRRLLIISWRTPLADGAHEISRRAHELAEGLGLSGIDLLTLELDSDLRDPGLLADLRRLVATRWLAVSGPPGLIDETIQIGQFDGVAMRNDPVGGWTEPNRLRASRAAARGMAVSALDVGLAPPAAEAAPAVKRGLLSLFGRRPAPPEPKFQVQAPGWTAQQIAVAHALTDPAISTVMVQPRCIETLEALAAAVQRDLPAGAQAQIEMARFSDRDEAEPRRRNRRA